MRMELRLNGHVLPIAQLGPNFLVLKNSIDHPPAGAEIFMSIDGHEECWPVHLHQGVSAGEHKTAISNSCVAMGPASENAGCRAG